MKHGVVIFGGFFAWGLSSCNSPSSRNVEVETKADSIQSTEKKIDSMAASSVTYVGPLSSVLSEIEGCGCYFAESEEKYFSGDIEFAASYDSSCYVAIENQPVKLRLTSTTRKEGSFGDYDHSSLFGNESYKVTIDLKYKGHSGEESSSFEGTLTIENKEGKITTKKIVGECGC